MHPAFSDRELTTSLQAERDMYSSTSEATATAAVEAEMGDAQGNSSSRSASCNGEEGEPSGSLTAAAAQDAAFLAGVHNQPGTGSITSVSLNAAGAATRQSLKSGSPGSSTFCDVGQDEGPTASSLTAAPITAAANDAAFLAEVHNQAESGSIAAVSLNSAIRVAARQSPRNNDVAGSASSSPTTRTKLEYSMSIGSGSVNTASSLFSYPTITESSSWLALDATPAAMMLDTDDSVFSSSSSSCSSRGNTMTHLIARTSATSSLTSMNSSPVFPTAMQSPSSVISLAASDAAVRQLGNHDDRSTMSNSSCTITTVHTLPALAADHQTMLANGGSISTINSIHNQDDVDAKLKAADEFRPPPVLAASSAFSSNNNDASNTQERDRDVNLQYMEDMVLAKRVVTGTQRLPTANSGCAGTNNGKCGSADPNNNIGIVGSRSIFDHRTSRTLPVVDEQSILDYMDQDQSSQAGGGGEAQSLGNGSSVAGGNAAAFQRLRSAHIRPGAYHQAPGQVAIRRLRPSVTSLEQQQSAATIESTSSVSASLFSDGTTAIEDDGGGDYQSVASAQSLWPYQSNASSAGMSDEFSYAFSISSFSLQGHQEQQDHLPSDVMMMMDADVPPTPGTPGSTARRVDRRSISSGNEDYEQGLFDEESIGSFSVSVTASPSQPNNSPNTSIRRSISAPIPTLLSTALAELPPNVPTQLEDDPANADLVHAHPVQPQDTSNLVAADPIHKRLSYKGPLLWSILVCMVLVVGGVVAGVVIYTSGAGDMVARDKVPTARSSRTVPPMTKRGSLMQRKLEEDLGSGMFDDGLAVNIASGPKLKMNMTAHNLDSDAVCCRKALNWLINDDELYLNHTSSNLLQRFLMGYFYYHTSEQSRWVSCNPSEGRETHFCSYHYVSPFGNGDDYDESPWHIRWLSHEHECDWAGVYCNDASQVDDISLNGYNLSGTFPTQISRLSNLTSLSLRDNYFVGQLPSELATIPNLKVLRMNRNLFTGRTPEEWGVMTSLVNLDVGWNQLTGTLAMSLNNLTNLENLWIDHNQFSGNIPTSLSSLSKLRHLLLNHNGFVGPIPSIGLLTDLEYLDISANSRITGTIPSEIGHLSQLLDLVVSSTSLQGTLPSELFGLGRLQDLKLDGCNFTGTISANIAKMTGLQNMCLASNAFSGELPSDFENLKALVHVQLQDNHFVGAVPDSMCLLKGPNTLKELVADCAPPLTSAVIDDNKVPPYLECPDGCCTSCCDVDTRICFPN